MEFRKLFLKDKEALEQLITVIESNMKNKYFWLPIKEEARKHFFDNEWTEFYGLFDSGVLIAAAALFYNEYEFGESLKQLNIGGRKVAEIGRAMVHPKYRGHNLLYQINKNLIAVANRNGLEYVLATIHPENEPSQRSFRKAGLMKMDTYVKNDAYVRDIFVIKLG